VALADSCSSARYLGVSTLHIFKIDVVSLGSSSTDYQHCNFGYDPSTISSFDAPFKTLLGILGYWALLFEASSRSARLQGLHEVGPARFLVAMLRRSGCLYTSFDQDHDLVFLSFLEHQTRHVVCFNARGLLYECVFDALLFSSSYRPVGKSVSHHVVTRPIFLFSSLFRTIIPAILPAMMLGYYS
jgi:hypothetical protein